MNQNYLKPNPCYDSNSFGFNQPSQYTIDHQEDINQQSMNDVDNRWNKIIESGNKIIQILGEMEIQQEQAANLRPQGLSHNGNEDLNIIPEKESDEFIKSSVKDLIHIPRKAVTFSNPLFNSNDDFISSSDESLSDEDVPEDNVKIYSNPLFEFDDKYISSDVNPLFDEVLENIESKDSYDSNLDVPDLLVTPLFDVNEDECFDSRCDVDKINDFKDGYSKGYILYLESLLNDDLVHHNLSIHAISVASILEGFTDEPPLEENDEWKKILYDA
nr:hypothetical protein [Tanacetum cinerariifolium]